MTPEEHLAAALAGLGFAGDPEMARTPELVARLLAEFLPVAPPPLEPLDTLGGDLVIMRDLPFHSLCAHHLLPFFGTVTLAYRPQGRIAGLGALARLVEHLARRPQLQERLAASVADTLLDGLGAASVGVTVSARQLCVEMRGARVPATFEVVATRGAADPDLLAALRAR